MRFYIKKQLLQHSEFLLDCHKNIKNKLDKIDINLLIQCQETAVYIGSIIAEKEQYNNIVSDLEEYCENVYLINNELIEIDDKKKILNSMNLSMKKIKDEIKKIPEKYEIVFLPYKASMWDSMESVWIEANKDERYNVKVIPIPYIEKGKNNTVKWEGNEFPSYVPITLFSDYDIEKMHPEIILFHNPYDEYNIVTSVIPDFYSDKLKKNTEILAYIPYYVTGGSQSDCFYNLPSYYYADFIFTQNENFKKYFHEHHSCKIVSYGSPKIDKVLNCDLKICYEKDYKWKKKNNKKILLYNTSISSILQQKEKAINKMRYVFECCKNRDDIELIWRPHPLTLATIDSIATELKYEYESVRDMFINEDIGILDNTPDVTRAVVVADAYIGEETSSIVHLFGVQGKPIFLLDESKSSYPIKQSIENYICFSDFIKIDNKIWFVHNFLPALFLYDIKNESVEFIKYLPFDGCNKTRTYCKIVHYNNKLVLIPMSARDICIYDTETKSLTTIPLNKSYYSNFMQAKTYNNKLFIIPTAYDAIVEFDMDTYEIKYHHNCISSLKNKTGYDGGYNFMYGVVQLENKLYLSSVQSNYVMEFDMDNGKYNFYRVGSKGSTYWDMIYDGEFFWLNPFKGKKIVRWDKNNNQYKEFNHYPSGFEGESECFLRLVEYDNKIIAIPKTSNMFIEINKQTGKLTRIDLKLKQKNNNVESKNFEWGSNYYFAKKTGEKELSVMSSNNNEWMVIDIETYSYHVFKINNLEKTKIELLKNGFGNKGENLPYAARESQIFTLNTFIDYLVRSEHCVDAQIREYSKVINNIDGSCGKKIFNLLNMNLEKRTERL